MKKIQEKAKAGELQVQPEGMLVLQVVGSENSWPFQYIEC